MGECDVGLMMFFYRRDNCPGTGWILEPAPICRRQIMFGLNMFGNVIPSWASGEEKIFYPQIYCNGFAGANRWLINWHRFKKNNLEEDFTQRREVLRTRKGRRRLLGCEDYQDKKKRKSYFSQSSRRRRGKEI